MQKSLRLNPFISIKNNPHDISSTGDADLHNFKSSGGTMDLAAGETHWLLFAEASLT
jgi:hypothetical protein